MAQSGDLDIRRAARPHRPRRLLGLFEEAWRRQRRRRARVLLIALAALIAAAVLVRVDLPSGRRALPAPVRLSRLSSGGLPASGHFASLTQVGGRLIAAGGPDGYPLNVSGATTTLVDGRAQGRCTAAVVVPHTVRLGRLRRANCGDPALYGLHVLPILAYEPRRMTVSVRIAVVDGNAPDGYRLGPTVMTYAECSDCGAQWIVGDHALWINGPFARGPDGAPGELLRISSTTGRVLQRIAMPELVRALLAVNESGLWIAPSIETGGPPAHLSPRGARRYESLLLVAPGARRPREMVDVGTDGLPWLAAAGRRVWFERRTRQYGRIATFTGDRVADLRDGPRQRIGRDWGDEIGEGTVSYAANPTGDVDAVVDPDDHDEALVAYDTRTLTERVLAVTPQTDAYEEPPDVAVDDGGIYFMDPSPVGPQSGAVSAELFRFAGR